MLKIKEKLLIGLIIDINNMESISVHWEAKLESSVYDVEDISIHLKVITKHVGWIEFFRWLSLS